jgi:hypothetical protein
VVERGQRAGHGSKNGGNRGNLPPSDIAVGKQVLTRAPGSESQ